MFGRRQGYREGAAPPIGIDPGAMDQLIEQSHDIHSDAMVTTTVALDELVETGLEARAHGDIEEDESRQVAEERSRLIGAATFGVACWPLPEWLRHSRR